MKFLIVAAAVIVIGFTSIGYFVPLSQVAYAEKVDYQETETYVAEEPYQDLETYIVQEPYQSSETYMVQEVYLDSETYTEKEPYVDVEIYSEMATVSYEEIKKYETIGSYQPPNKTGIWLPEPFNTIYYPIACIDLKNAEAVPGDFSIGFSLWALDKQSKDPISSIKNTGFLFTGNSSFSLLPFETKTFSAKFDVDINKYNYMWEYSIKPGTRIVQKERLVTKYKDVEVSHPITKYKDIEKTRSVTKYSDVAKTREVTKTRQVEKQRPVTKQRIVTRYEKVPLFKSWFR